MRPFFFDRILPSLLAIAALMSAAIWNGFPIVYSDTSSYIGSGFELDTLVDRPITYGLFLRITSLNGTTLWSVVLAQCALLWWCLSITIRWFGIEKIRTRALIVVILCIGTGLPFVSGQLLADIFTPILVLTILLIVLEGDLSTGEKSGLYTLFTLAFAMHMSHLPLAILLLPFTLVLSRSILRRPINWSRIIVIFPLIALGLIPMGASLAKSKHVFFMARMAEAGILNIWKNIAMKINSCFAGRGGSIGMRMPFSGAMKVHFGFTRVGRLRKVNSRRSSSDLSRILISC